MLRQFSDPVGFFLLINDLFYLNLRFSQLFLFKVTIQKSPINTRVQFISMESISLTINKLVDQLPVTKLDLLLDEILHSILLAQVSQLGQLFLTLRHSVTTGHLLLKLGSLLFLLFKLLNLGNNKDFKVDGLLAFLLPLSHIVRYFLEVVL